MVPQGNPRILSIIILGRTMYLITKLVRCITSAHMTYVCVENIVKLQHCGYFCVGQKTMHTHTQLENSHIHNYSYIYMQTIVYKTFA